MGIEGQHVSCQTQVEEVAKLQLLLTFSKCPPLCPQAGPLCPSQEDHI